MLVQIPKEVVEEVEVPVLTVVEEQAHLAVVRVFLTITYIA